MALSKARIYEDGNNKSVFLVQFNPNSLSYSIHANQKSYKKIQEKREKEASSTTAQSDPTQNTSMAYLSVTLFFHTYKNESSFTDVREDVSKLQNFLRNSGNDPSANQTIATSPTIVFAWGTIAHKGFLDNFSVTYQMFASDGTPVQAEVSVTICGSDLGEVGKKLEKARTAESEVMSDTTELRKSGKLPGGIVWLF